MLRMRARNLTTLNTSTFCSLFSGTHRSTLFRCLADLPCMGYNAGFRRKPERGGLPLQIAAAHVRMAPHGSDMDSIWAHKAHL